VNIPGFNKLSASSAASVPAKEINRNHIPGLLCASYVNEAVHQSSRASILFATEQLKRLCHQLTIFLKAYEIKTGLS
jgi:hypothetical protein